MKKQKDIALNDFNFNLLTIAGFPIIAIYNSPTDYPGKYIARLWNIDQPTQFITIRYSLEESRKTIPSHMTRLGACSMDDPVIVETWL